MAGAKFSSTLYKPFKMAVCAIFK